MCDCMRHASAEGVKDWRCPECGTWYAWVYAEMDGYWKPQTLVDHSDVKRTWDDNPHFRAGCLGVKISGPGALLANGHGPDDPTRRVEPGDVLGMTLPVDHIGVHGEPGEMAKDHLRENNIHPNDTGAMIEDSAFVYVQKPEAVTSADADHADEMAAKVPVPGVDYGGGLRDLARVRDGMERTAGIMPPGAPEAFGMDELPGQVVNTLVGHYAHPSAIVDAGAVVGIGTKIWHFSHIMAGARIGERCVLGQNVHIASGVHIGDGVKIQNNVSLYDGCVIEDDVFIGPSAVFTNVKTPRAFVNRKDEYLATRICRGASIGANATIVCGVTVGEYAFVGAGAVVVKNIPPYALAVGVPAKVVGIVCGCGERLDDKILDVITCKRCGAQYILMAFFPTLKLRKVTDGKA